MKHTLMYFKIIVLILLCLIMMFGFICRALLAIAGLVGALADKSALPLVLVAVGLFCGFMGFVALDAIEYINDKWEWHKQ